MLRRILLAGSSIATWTLAAGISISTSTSPNPHAELPHQQLIHNVDTSIESSPSSAPPSSPTASHSLAARQVDPAQNFFTNPAPAGAQDDFSNDTSYAVGELVQVQWKSEWQTVDLSICQPTRDGAFGCAPLIKATLSKGFAYTVANATNGIPLPGAPFSADLYFLQLTQPNQQNPYVWSHYFNITKAANASDGDDNGGTAAGVSPTSTPSLTSPSSSPSTIPSSPPPTTSSTPHSTNPNPPNLPLLIIAIPAILGGAAVTGAIWWIVWWRRRRSKRLVAGGGGGGGGIFGGSSAKVGITESTSTLTSPVPLQEMHADSYVHETGAGLPHEAGGEEVPMELPAEIPGLAVSRYSNGSSIYDGGWEDAGATRREGHADDAGVPRGADGLGGGALAEPQRANRGVSAIGGENWFGSDGDSLRTTSSWGGTSREEDDYDDENVSRRSSWAADAHRR